MTLTHNEKKRKTYSDEKQRILQITGPKYKICTVASAVELVHNIHRI